MSKVDIVLIIILIIGAYSGYKEGFLMELISLGAIILGVFLGFKLMGIVMILLEEKFNADKATLPYLSFGVIFILVVFLVRLLGKSVKNSMDKTFLGTMDQVMGSALGGFKTLFMMSILLWIVDSLRVTLPEAWTDDSWLYPFTARLAPSVANWLGDYIPAFKEIFRQF